jgi:hypothetical protein
MNSTQWLDFRGALQTLIPVVADHGESLWEYGEQTHTMFFYDTTIRVALIPWRPGGSRRFLCDRRRLPPPALPVLATGFHHDAAHRPGAGSW